MNNPYLDSTFIYRSMTNSASFKAQPRSKSRSRLPRAFINRLRASSRAEPPADSNEGKIKFKVDKEKEVSGKGKKDGEEPKKQGSIKKKKKKKKKKKDKKKAGKPKSGTKSKQQRSESDSERSRSEGGSDECGTDEGSASETVSESNSDDDRYAKGRLQMHKQRSISMNSLLQDFFAKIDKQAREPALSLVTPASSRSPSGGPSELSLSDTTYGSGQHAMPDLPKQGTGSEDTYTSLEDDERWSNKHSSGSDSFPAVPSLLSASRRFSIDLYTTTSISAAREDRNLRKDKENELKGHYVGTGVDLMDSSESSDWSRDDKSRVVCTALSESDAVSGETNAYGGVLCGSESSESSSALDESSESEEDTGNLTGGGLEEILQAFAKRYVRILEDGKALEKSDEEEGLKTVLKLRTLQQLQELSLELIKSTQANPNAKQESPLPLRMPQTGSSDSPAPTPRKEKKRRRPTTGYGKSMDWNGTFQDILWVNEGDDRSLIDRYHALKDLAHDFNHAARTYATIIIEEAFLPYSQKTIPPIRSLGGQAGGEKYVHAGILFKFATDAAGIYRGDEYAMKAAGHELKGLINFYKVHHFGICVPLMTIIGRRTISKELVRQLINALPLDYRGFRLVAQALLPIGDDTLVYGSSDAGATVRNDSPEIERALVSACRELNLAKHLVYPKHGEPIEMYGPGDMEGHFGLDGRYYLIDFARVFPPETPESGTKGAFLYKLLRPELVARNSVPLSSDSFSRFGGPTMDLREPHDTNTKCATDVLVGELVPRFAQWLDRQYDRALPDQGSQSSSSFTEFLLPVSAISTSSDELTSLSIEESWEMPNVSCGMVTDTERMPEIGDVDDWASPIIQEMHRMGINVRYMGMVRSRCKNEAAKGVLLSEMICRVVKNLLRERLRARMRALCTMAEEPYKEVILELFNRILGDPPEAANRWWSQDVKSEISKRFKQALALDELDPSYDLRRSYLVPYPSLFVRLQLLTAVRLTPVALNDLKHGDLTALVSADIRGQGVSGKDMNIVSTAEAIALAIRCLDGSTSAREADRLLRLAIKKFEKAIGRMPGDMELINYYANFLFRKVSRFVQQVLPAGCGINTSRRTTQGGSRRKYSSAGDEFATWAEERWKDDVEDEESYWANANTAESTNGSDVTNTSKLFTSGGSSTAATATTLSGEDEATSWAKWTRSIRWHMALLSKMLKLFKTCENFVMLNFMADLCKQFATQLKQMDTELKRTYKASLRQQQQRLMGGAAGKRSVPNSPLSYSAPSSGNATGGSSIKANFVASLPGGASMPRLTLSPSSNHPPRGAILHEGIQERDRDRRRDLLFSFQLQALYLTHECYMAIAVVDESSTLQLVFSFPPDYNSVPSCGLNKKRSPRTLSVPSLRQMASPTPSTALNVSSTLQTLLSREPTSNSTEDLPDPGNEQSDLTIKEKRSSVGMHIFPHRSASFIGKKMIPFVYFRWAELQFLRARILEKKTRLEQRLREAAAAEGMRNEEEEEKAWINSKETEIENLRAISGLRYRAAFHVLEEKESRNIVRREFTAPSGSSSSVPTRSSGEKDARRWALDVYPDNVVQQNICLASVMELYRCNLEKHGRWSALVSETHIGGSLSSIGNTKSSESFLKEKKERKALSDKAKRSEDKEEEDSDQQDPNEDQQKESKKKKEKGKKDKKEKDRNKKKREESDKQEIGNAEKSDQARVNREEEAQKALLMQEMKKAKEKSRNKNKIQRPEDEEEAIQMEGRKLRIVVSDDGTGEQDSSSSGSRKGKPKARSDSSTIKSSASKESGERTSRIRSSKDRTKASTSISAHIRSQKLRTFDDKWLPVACLSDELFLNVLRNVPVQEIILGAHARHAKRTTGSDRKTKRSRSSTTSEALQNVNEPALSQGKRRSAQLSIDDMSSMQSPTGRRSGLLSPFGSSTSSMGLPPPASFSTGRSCRAIYHNVVQRGSASPAISIDALQKAAACGSLNELTHIALSRYEDMTDAQFESIVRIQHTSLTSIRLEGCLQISDKTLQHMSTSLFAPHLRHLSFKDCPRITNRGVLELVKSATNIVSLSLDGCEKISNKPIIYMAKGSVHLRHLSLMGCKKISDKSIVEIATHATNLASLRVSSERVTDIPLLLMGKHLAHLYSLTMAHCNITIEGVQAVCSGVASDKLAYLCIVDCERFYMAREQLMNIIRPKCPNLAYLFVREPSNPLTGRKL